MCGTWKFAALIAGSVLSTTAATAQPLGQFDWQLVPYCNRIVVNITQVGTIFTLDGYDDQCGAVRRASVVGTAFQNPSGDIGLAMTIVATPGGAPVHLDARINLPSLNGLWFDSAAGSGTFVFDGAGGGPARPVGARSGPIEINATLSALPEIRLNGGLTDPLDIVGYSSGGSIGAPSATIAGQSLLTVGAGGFGGTQFTGATAGMVILARQGFTNTAHGTGMVFATTPNDTTDALTRLLIEANGNVGIGTSSVSSPTDKLQVLGDVRVGTGGTNGCIKRFDGTSITGSCSSDVRFKRDITPFSSSLDAVTRLRPVHYYWRSAEFPQRAFGTEQTYGLVAQDVAEVLPELIGQDEDGYKTVDYAKLPLLAIQAIKELKEKNDALEQRLTALETATIRR